MLAVSFVRILLSVHYNNIEKEDHCGNGEMGML
jgi:hypothetical protein